MKRSLGAICGFISVLSLYALCFIIFALPSYVPLWVQVPTVIISVILFVALNDALFRVNKL